MKQQILATTTTVCEVDPSMPADDLIFSGEIPTPETTCRIVNAAYDWTIDKDGRVWGLVAGDMGYAPTCIMLSDTDILACADMIREAENEIL